MIKNTLSVFAVAATLALASCSSNPSDLRPETKVSFDSVPPGERNNTSNIDNARSHEAADRPDVYINHDEHEKATAPNTHKEVPASQQTTEKKAVENHQ